MSNNKGNSQSERGWRGRARGRGRGRGQGPGNFSRGQNDDPLWRGSARRNDGPVPELRQRPQAAGQSLEFLPSISRSGGQGGHGDTLKQINVQNSYWVTIQSKIEDHWTSQYQVKDSTRKENESNLLLHLRKLREGILSSDRKDLFALAVYETSFYLAIIFESPVYVASSQAHLIDLLTSLSGQTNSPSSPLLQRATTFLVISSLLSLNEGYRSQKEFYRLQHSARKVPRPSHSVECLSWIRSLRSSMNTQNHIRCQQLLDTKRVESLLDQLISSEQATIKSKSPFSDDVVTNVVHKLTGSLRDKLRESSWQIMRSAYRELTVSMKDGNDLANTAWAGRFLFFNVNEDLKGENQSISPALESWMQQKVEEGLLAEKAGVDGRYTISRKKN